MANEDGPTQSEWQRIAASIERLNSVLDRVEGRLVQQDAERFFKEINVRIPADGEQIVAVPPGSGGLIIYSPNEVDLSNLQVSYGPVVLSFGAGSYTQWAPIPGTITTVRMKNLTSNLLAISAYAVSAQYAAGFAPLVMGLGSAVKLIGPDGKALGTTTDNPDGSILLTELNGSSAPLVAAAPRLLHTFNYSDIPTSGTFYWTATAGALSRNARQRTYVFGRNTYNQQVTITSLAPGDSTIVAGSLSDGTTGLPANVVLPTNIFSMAFTSEAYPGLAAHVDVIEVAISGGATAPTAGTLPLYVVELF